jgi:hypothetical protein
MNIEELRRQFIMDGDAVKSRLEPLVTKALRHCKIDKAGQVLITNTQLSSKDQVLIVLAARGIASELDPSISADVTIAEIAKCTGLPTNQVRARGTDAIKGKWAEASKPGTYRAIPHRVETFLDSLVSD